MFELCSLSFSVRSKNALFKPRTQGETVASLDLNEFVSFLSRYLIRYDQLIVLHTACEQATRPNSYFDLR